VPWFGLLRVKTNRLQPLFFLPTTTVHPPKGRNYLAPQLASQICRFRSFLGAITIPKNYLKIMEADKPRKATYNTRVGADWRMFTLKNARLTKGLLTILVLSICELDTCSLLRPALDYRDMIQIQTSTKKVLSRTLS
jgi:hypothetical protein